MCAQHILITHTSENHDGGECMYSDSLEHGHVAWETRKMGRKVAGGETPSVVHHHWLQITLMVARVTHVLNLVVSLS